MKYFEYGQENPQLMVMLPGGGVCYRGAEPTAKEMAKTYHVILVAYDGFNPSEPDTEFKVCRTKPGGWAITLWSTAAERSIFCTASPTAPLF